MNGEIREMTYELSVLESIKAMTCDLIKAGHAYVDDIEGDDTARDNNPIIDLMIFQTYSLQRIGSGTEAVLRLKMPGAENTKDPVIYQRDNGILCPHRDFYNIMVAYMRDAGRLAVYPYLVARLKND